MICMIYILPGWEGAGTQNLDADVHSKSMEYTWEVIAIRTAFQQVGEYLIYVNTSLAGRVLVLGQSK